MIEITLDLTCINCIALSASILHEHIFKLTAVEYNQIVDILPWLN